MQNVKRVATGIPGLDAMTNGGFLPRTANLVEGAPGTGKSTLGVQYIYEARAVTNRASSSPSRSSPSNTTAMRHRSGGISANWSARTSSRSS